MYAPYPLAGVRRQGSWLFHAGQLGCLRELQRTDYAHLRDSVRLKWRQSEERKSWSRSLSSSSLAPPGKAVRFLQ